MLGYGTGTGTGTVREGKGREGIRDTFFNTYISDTLQVGIVDMCIKPQSGRRYMYSLFMPLLPENRE